MRVLIVGAGVVGATIAYELSEDDRFQITVLDGNPGPPLRDATDHLTSKGLPTSALTSTEAALGVLMAAVAKKEKGRNLNMRLAGVDWYDRVIPDLIEVTGLEIPYNRQGLLLLQYQSDRFEDDRRLWEKLAQIRPSQKRRLEIWYPNQLRSVCPQIQLQQTEQKTEQQKEQQTGKIWGAVYSPNDRQVHPAKLTQALIQAAQQRGVQFQFGQKVLGITSDRKGAQVQTSSGLMSSDVVVVSAGLGSSAISKNVTSKNVTSKNTIVKPVPQSAASARGITSAIGLELRPVLGQAIQVRMQEPIGTPGFQPVISGHDIHLVPVNQTIDNLDYWVGATVEFGAEDATAETLLVPDANIFESLWQQACGMIPALQSATVVHQWHGVRPRPVDRPAPVIEWISENSKVLLATGHYRNGVLLAPATAIEVRSKLEGMLE